MPGVWDVVIKNTDGQSAILKGGFTITAPMAKPIVTVIVPDIGLNIDSIEVSVTGENFYSGISVRLIKSREDDIVGIDISVIDSSRISCRFDLTGKAPGKWDVLVRNVDGQSGILADGFTIISSPVGEEILVYPNPYRVDYGGEKKIIFGNLPKEAIIRVYTISGGLVNTIEHKSGTRGSSKKWDIYGVDSGVYIYSVQTPSEMKGKGKISILK